ncbi:GxxExxY protein [Oribacterium sp. WCC10]|uniref:GxxExxY protein n=1 Tax=Oribacterium sp. WCC10 TaxID=1855343 RepID=UPI0008EEA5B5|nr:AAA family ATPase [Oribacterium sp. WCC10]SFG65337.1 PD-(D/E)XK nuclease superfamily protein [Oribacterium sp. WCC10]
MKEFNTTAVCIPEKHYMVDLSERVKEIKKLVDSGKYFTINRARQYGKTTTIDALYRVLKDQYIVISLDFQDIEDGSFINGGEFSKAFARILLDASDFEGLTVPEDIKEKLQALNDRETTEVKMDDLFRVFRNWFLESTEPIVLIIDEVDTATNNQVFLDFLAQLRSLYLKREKNPKVKTFQSVILAGVNDVKHLRSKIRDEDQRKKNSPWNIAADFDIDMSLSETGIKGMLDEYEADHQTGMDTADIAKEIREYTNGYPFLVSRICQLIDEQVSKKISLSEAWTKNGLDEAVKLILQENNTLFQSLTKNLNNLPKLKESIRSILMEGTKITYNAQQDEIVEMQMYGLIRNDHNTVRVANRIFETMLYNLFLSEEELKNNVFSKAGDLAKNQFIADGKLNMRLIMERFIATYTEVFGPLEERFKEKDGREQFLLYIKPIINGTGNYYIEAQTRDQTRTDIIVDYLGQQYIIELKIWRGDRYNAEGEKQISEYLDYFGLTTGYMLSFNFNKNKETGVHPVYVGDKLLYEGVV